jgi:hypothetical protein
MNELEATWRPKDITVDLEVAKTIAGLLKKEPTERTTSREAEETLGERS